MLVCVPECASQRPTSAVVARPLPQGQTSPSRLSRLACPWAQSSSSPHLPSAGITTVHHHSWLCPVGSWGRTQSKASVHLLNPMAQSLSLATVFSTIYFCLSMRSMQQSLEHRKLSKKMFVNEESSVLTAHTWARNRNGFLPGLLATRGTQEPWWAVGMVGIVSNVFWEILFNSRYNRFISDFY